MAGADAEGGIQQSMPGPRAEPAAGMGGSGPRRRGPGGRIMRGVEFVVMAVVFFFVLIAPAYVLVRFLPPVPAICAVVGWTAVIALHPWLIPGPRRPRWQATLGVRALDRSTLFWLAGAVLLFQCYQWISPALRIQLTSAMQPRPDPYLREAEPLGWLVAPLMTALLMPVAEEFAVRGYLQHKLGRAFGRRSALAVASVLFGLFHGSLRLAPFFILAGLVFGSALLAFRSIWAPVLLHAVANSLGRIPATAGVPRAFEPVAHGYWPWLLTPVFAGGAFLFIYGGYRAGLAARRRRREARAGAPPPCASMQPA